MNLFASFDEFFVNKIQYSHMVVWLLCRLVLDTGSRDCVFACRHGAVATVKMLPLFMHIYFSSNMHMEERTYSHAYIHANIHTNLYFSYILFYCVYSTYMIYIYIFLQYIQSIVNLDISVSYIFFNVHLLKRLSISFQLRLFWLQFVHFHHEHPPAICTTHPLAIFA